MTRDTIVFTSKECNFAFLAELGLSKNWRRDCVICHAPNIEVAGGINPENASTVIFRPCGHQICLEPCAAKFAPQCKIRSEISVNTSSYDINCPSCGRRPEKMFIAERNYFGDSIDVKRIVSKLMAELGL